MSTVGEEKYLFLYLCMFSAGVSVTKDRGKRKAHIYGL